jgi:hypothetical protein
VPAENERPLITVMMDIDKIAPIVRPGTFCLVTGPVSYSPAQASGDVDLPKIKPIAVDIGRIQHSLAVGVPAWIQIEIGLRTQESCIATVEIVKPDALLAVSNSRVDQLIIARRPTGSFNRLEVLSELPGFTAAPRHNPEITAQVDRQTTVLRSIYRKIRSTGNRDLCARVESESQTEKDQRS